MANERTHCGRAKPPARSGGSGATRARRRSSMRRSRNSPRMAMPRPRLEDVAARARVSKGLPYLYFKTKEELFKAVVRSVITAHFDAMRERMEKTDAVGRGLSQGTVPLLHPGAGRLQARLHRAASDRRRAQASGTHRLLLRAGGLARHRDHDALDRSRRRARRVQTHASARYPQLLFAPVLTAIFWRALFERHHHLDTDGMLDTNIELSDRRDQGAAAWASVQGRSDEASSVVSSLAWSRLHRSCSRCCTDQSANKEFPGYMEADLVLVGSEQGGRVLDAQPSRKAIPSRRRSDLHAGKLGAGGLGRCGRVARAGGRGPARGCQGRNPAAGRDRGARGLAQRGAAPCCKTGEQQSRACREALQQGLDHQGRSSTKRRRLDDRDEAAVAEAEKRIGAAKLPGRSDMIDAATANAEAAKHALTEAETNIAKRSVSRPAEGTIEEVYFRPGEVVKAGQGGARAVAAAQSQSALLRCRAGARQTPASTRSSMSACDGCPPDLTARSVSSRARPSSRRR